jgi:CheY-like chemotaxis protein
MPGDREQAFAAGCIGYISKPIDTRTLGDQIREYLPELLESGFSG